MIDASFVASMPDISEFPGCSLADWKKWFIDTARLILSATPDNGLTIFYQTDIKHEGVWIDKSYLCQQAAAGLGRELLWHKIACRIKPGTSTAGRPTYSHILCFSKTVRLDPRWSSADVLPDLGEKVWERGMGIHACTMIANYIANYTNSTTVVNPFCGQGSMLAAANKAGLSAIGIERGKKRADAARVLTISDEGRWEYVRTEGVE